MAVILNGKPVAERLRESLRERIAALAERGVLPCLATVQVGADGADASYVRGIEKSCAAVGVRLLRYELPADCGQAALEQVLRDYAADAAIHGILLFRPLTKGLDPAAAALCIPPEKDVDCMTEASLAGVYLGSGSFAPCTPEACLRLLSHYGVDCAGKHAVVVGRSQVVGRPLATLLLRQDATVTVCHSKTQNLAEICKSADLLIVAVGKPRLIGAAHIRPGATVLDVGVHWDAQTGAMTGDVDFDAAAPLAGAITPVPGGVGSVTSTVLASHVVAAAEQKGAL